MEIDVFSIFAGELPGELFLSQAVCECVEYYSGGGGDIEAVYEAAHGDAEKAVGKGADLCGYAVFLGAEDDGKGAFREVYTFRGFSVIGLWDSGGDAVSALFESRENVRCSGLGCGF